MKEEACGDRRRWEDQIYWTHFQCLRFSQFLHAGFDRQLAIPENFTRNLKRKLPATVTLRSPCGVEWEIGITTKENTFFFYLGWQEFVKDYSLEENDILVFKYDGESCFDVLAFSGRSMCEKVASYFLRKCCHRGDDTGCHLKSRGVEISAEAAVASPGDSTGVPLPRKPRQKNVYTKPFRKNLNSRPVIKKARREIKFPAPITTTNSARNKEFDTCAADIEAKPDIKQTGFSISGRRPITEEDKRRVLHLANAILTPEGFLSVMKPTNVNKKFYLNIPTAWLTKHISLRINQDVILRINENTWRTGLFYRKDRNRGGFSGGWKKFVLDNNLHEFDVCVFEPGSQLNNSIVLDVSIFHVV